MYVFVIDIRINFADMLVTVISNWSVGIIFQDILSIACYHTWSRDCIYVSVWLKVSNNTTAVTVCCRRYSVHYGFIHYDNSNPYPTAFPYGNGMVLHFYQQQESSTTKTVHKVINKGLKTYV